METRARKAYPSDLTDAQWTILGPLVPASKHGGRPRKVNLREVINTITPEDFPRLVVIFGDNKYHNHTLEAWLKEHRPNWRVEVKKRPEGTRGFTPLEKRWVVERTNAWNGRCRRNSKDYERRIESSAAMIHVSNIHLMLRRLSPGSRPAFHYQAAA